MADKTVGISFCSYESDNGRNFLTALLKLITFKNYKKRLQIVEVLLNIAKELHPN